MSSVSQIGPELLKEDFLNDCIRNKQIVRIVTDHFAKEFVIVKGDTQRGLLFGFDSYRKLHSIAFHNIQSVYPVKAIGAFGCSTLLN